MIFYKLLPTFVGHFCPPGSGSGSTDPIEYGSNPDPDPGSGSTTLKKRELKIVKTISAHSKRVLFRILGPSRDAKVSI
jgi:hypothetical protein